MLCLLCSLLLECWILAFWTKIILMNYWSPTSVRGKNKDPFENSWLHIFLELSARKIQKSAKWWRTTEEFIATGWVWEVLSWPVYCYNLQNTSLLLQWWDFFEGIWEQICQKRLCYLVMFIFIIPAVMTTTVLQGNLITALLNRSHRF